MYDFERPCVEENGENDDIANEYPCFVLQLFQIKYTLLPLNSKCSISVISVINGNLL